MKSRIDLFWEKADRSGGGAACWPHSGHKSKGGYARVSVRNRTVTAHRAAWEFVNGKIPDGLCVLHRCDNPPCCNPAHLFLGTKAENNRDRREKGRSARQAGERNGQSRLTEHEVFEVFNLRRSGMTQRDIGKAFGVSESAVWCILHGKKWNYLRVGRSK